MRFSLSQSQKSFLLTLLFSLAIFLGWRLYRRFYPEQKPASYHSLIQEIKTNPGHLKMVRIDKKTEKIEALTTDSAPKDKVIYEGPSDLERRELLSLLEQAKIDHEFLSRDEGLLATFLGTWLPTLLVIGLMGIGSIFLFRFIQGGAGRGFPVGKAKIKTFDPESKSKVTFADVAGIEEAKAEVQELVDFLKDPAKFTKLGGRIPKGVLLTGPPGTGKTLLARAIAGEAGVTFFHSSGGSFEEMLVGVGAVRIRELFEQAKRSAPCIIFIDEIDSIGRQRNNKSRMTAGEDQTLNQLLVEMDGFDANEGVILIAATNRLDVLDQALLRPGRFDRHVMVSLPDVRGREEILKVHSRKVPLASDANLSVIARGTPGFSGAALEALINEAALLAAREGKDAVGRADLEEAKAKVIMGPERKSMVISDQEKRTTAYHEAGHTLVAHLIPHTDPVHLVTIIPRGPALGVTHQLPMEDRLSASKTYIEARIAVMMGGRVAEELVFKHVTTGASNDIEQATSLARKMVCEWGMSDTLGPLRYNKKEFEQELMLGSAYSEKTAELIDTEVRRIVTEQHHRVYQLLREHQDKLTRLAEALLERETLHEGDLKQLLSEHVA